MSADIWDQLTLDSTPTAPRDTDTCQRCGAQVRHIVAGNVCGWPAIVSQHPTNRTTALAAIVTGRDVYVRRRMRRATTWDRLDADNMNSKHAAGGDHHLEHVCGHDPPPPPPQPATAPDYTGPPPF